MTLAVHISLYYFPLLFDDSIHPQKNHQSYSCCLSKNMHSADFKVDRHPFPILVHKQRLSTLKRKPLDTLEYVDCSVDRRRRLPLCPVRFFFLYSAVFPLSRAYHPIQIHPSTFCLFTYLFYVLHILRQIMCKYPPSALNPPFSASSP